MQEQDEDQKQFFKDLGATAEQSVAEVRGFEENYYSLMQRMTAALPWLADLNKSLHGYVEQNFTAAFEFSHEIRQAKDAQDFLRIYTQYMQGCFKSFTGQMTDFAEIYAKIASGAIKAPSIRL